MSEWQPGEEVWRDLPGWEGSYQTSTLGRVRGAIGILGQWPNDQGYLHVRLSGPRKVLRVHRAVAVTFIPNPDGKPSINHLDCDRANNRVENLEWCTQAENLRHAERLGRMQRDYWAGRRSPNAMLTDDAVRQMRELYMTGKWSWQSIAHKFGVSKRCAGRALTKETYTDVQ